MQKLSLLRPTVLGLISLSLCLAATAWSGLSALSAGKAAEHTVINSLGGNDSVRILGQPANDIIYNPVDDKLYVSVPSSAGPTGNSLRKINPRDLTIGQPVWVGSEPNRLSLSSDNQAL